MDPSAFVCLHTFSYRTRAFTSSCQQPPLASFHMSNFARHTPLAQPPR